MSIVIVEIVSLIFMLTSFISLIVRDHVESSEYKIYKKLSIINIFGLIIEISLILLCIKIGTNSFITQSFTKLYLIYQLLFITLFSYYVNYISKESEDSKKTHRKYIICLIIIILLALILPVEFKSKYATYCVGPAVNLVYLYFGINLIVMFTKLIKNIKTIVLKKYTPLFLLIIGSVLVGIIQINYPQLIFMTILDSVIIFVMYHTIENPDVKLLEYEQKERGKIIQAAESKSEFLSSTSHELRTPLNAIIGLSEDIESFKDINPDILDDVKDLVNASNILLDIISNILDSSKIESGKLDVVESDYYPNKEYENLINVYRVKAFKKNIQLITNMSANIPEVLYGDKQRIKQIIANLLDNAVKFTDAGKVTISLDFNLDNLIISISDTGKGMKEEEVRNFLSPNNDLKIEKVYSSTGTGLGLSITKNLIKILHGTVNMQSTVLVGTKYVISIPQKIGNKEALEEQERDQLVDLSKLNYAGKRLLIVDDNPINIKVLKKAIASYNFEVEECYNGKDAIEKIEINNNYDLVFMDIMMPVMGGEEAMGRLKSMSNFTSPVIALTADAVSGATEKYKALGFNDYLSKPFSRDMVAKKLYSVLGGGEQ